MPWRILLLGLMCAAVSAEPLSPSSLQPAMRDSRAYLDSYSVWGLTDEGGVLFVSVLLSNLAGTPTRPGFSLSWYGPDGQRLSAEVELPGDSLKVGGPPLSLMFADNVLSAAPGGLDLHLTGPASGGGQLTADLHLKAGSPGHTWGDGAFAVDGGTFWLGQVFTSGALSGSVKVTGGPSPQGVALSGQAYADHSWQDVWAHHLARRWVNLRFYSDGPDLALSSWTDPKGATFSRAALAERGRIAASSTEATVTLTTGDADPASGYPTPQLISVRGGQVGELDVALGAPLESRDLLAGVSPVVKQLVSWFVARPHSFRYHGPATLVLPAEGGQSRRVQGQVVAEVIYVNAP